MTSKRIGFRRWQREDLALAKELWGDRRVTHLFTREPLSDKQIEERLEKEIAFGRDYQMQYWPIFELESCRHIGCGGLRPYKIADQIYELGFHLRPEFWGLGYATEAGRSIISYGFGKLQAKAIFAGHHPENSDSMRVLLKLGFEETGQEFYEPTGLLHPSYILRAP